MPEVVYSGVLTVLGTGSAPRINNLEHVAWKLLHPIGCVTLTDIFLYNGQEVQQITYDALSNQQVEINDHDQLVWTRFDFCASPSWESEIMLWIDGVTTQLTTGPHQIG